MRTIMNEAVEHLFDETARLTRIADYGIGWQEVVAGKAVIPGEGARFDITFEGHLSGKGISGTIKGIDYLTVEPDGRFVLDIHATVVTEDGYSIALREYGVLIPGKKNDLADLHLHMHFTTHIEQYSWLNKSIVRGVGNVNMEAGQLYVSAFRAVGIPVLN
jgi:hypothetical protein